MDPKINVKTSNPSGSSTKTGSDNISVQLSHKGKLIKLAFPEVNRNKYPEFVKKCLIKKVDKSGVFYVPLLGTDFVQITGVACWLIRDKIEIPDDIFERVANKSGKPLYDSMKGPYGYLVQLWLMAEEYHISELKNDVVSGFHRVQQMSDAPIGVASYIHKHTSSDSALHRLLVEVLARKCSANDLKKYKAELGEGIIYEIGHWFMKCRDNGKLKDLADRTYHGDKKEKCALFHDHKGDENAAKNCSWSGKVISSEKWKTLVAHGSYNRRK